VFEGGEDLGEKHEFDFHDLRQFWIRYKTEIIQPQNYNRKIIYFGVAGGIFSIFRGGIFRIYFYDSANS
jgi:hypothetical protein